MLQQVWHAAAVEHVQGAVVEHVLEQLCITSADGHINLYAFGSNVCDIAERAEVTSSALLAAKPFTLTHGHHVITSISRP